MLIEEGHDSVMQEMTKHLMLITRQYSWPPEGNAGGTVWVSAINQVGETLKGPGLCPSCVSYMINTNCFKLLLHGDRWQDA